MIATGRPCILLVDDEPNIVNSMAMVFRASGYKVTTARHGVDALSKLESEVPDVLVSDLNMPEMDGFELLGLVRQRYPLVLLIATSGIYDSGGRAPAGLDVDGFYAKGCTRPEKLLGTVAELIEARNIAASGPGAEPVALPIARVSAR